MDCPYCNQPMKQGSIRCNNYYHPLVWMALDKSAFRIVEERGKAIFKEEISDLWHCSACDVLIRKFAPTTLSNRKK